MSIIGQLPCLSTALIFVYVWPLLLKSAIATDSLLLEEYKFPCENGECIDQELWCDGSKDCFDGSDEKYCRHWHPIFPDPNNCRSNYFKCGNGPCIPMIGRCNGYNNCDDDSDETECEFEDLNLLALNYKCPQATVMSTNQSKIQGTSAIGYFASLNISQSSIDLEQFSSLSDVESQREKARSWLLSQRRGDFGWGNETPRALTSLYLSDVVRTTKSTESDMLMIKQLELQLSFELARNGTKPMKLTDLALYINALQVSCKNPENFYGENMVSLLREYVNVTEMESGFINPHIYLTLCLNKASTYEDTLKLQDMLLSKNATVCRIDIQALALLTTECIFQETDFLNASVYDNLKMEFLGNVKLHGFPGNVYEAALLFQALQKLKVTFKGFKDFIVKQQQIDGSFDDFISTYLVLPILAGRNLMEMDSQCGVKIAPSNDSIPLEVLKSAKRKKIQIQYSLKYSLEVIQTLQMHVAEGINFLNIMRLAEEISPKYRFTLIKNRDAQIVYSIGGLVNDVQKGMYWLLYKASGNSSENTNGTHWVSYNEDVKQLILEEGDKVMLWYRTL